MGPEDGGLSTLQSVPASWGAAAVGSFFSRAKGSGDTDDGVLHTTELLLQSGEGEAAAAEAVTDTVDISILPAGVFFWNQYTKSFFPAANQ